MMRAKPDAVRADAVRAVLERRIRAAARTWDSNPPRRHAWLPAAAAGMGSVLLIAGLAVGAQHLVPTTPSGSSGWSGSSPSADESVPTTTTTTPTPIPTPTPAASAQGGTPTPVPAAALVGETGAQVRTDAEIRAFARTHATVDPVVAGDQDVILVHCMAQHGWLYDPIRQYSADLTVHPGLTDEQWAAYQRAYGGPPSTGPYDWRTAGCDGLAVHETGQDRND